MDGTAQHVSDGEQNEHDGAELDAENHADNRADSCDVQQLDKHVFPVREYHAVHAVGVREGRGLAVVGAEHPLHELSVCEVAANQDGNADKECNHLLPTLKNTRLWDGF